MNPVIKFLVGLALAPLVGIVALSLMSSTNVEPVAWQPDPAPSLTEGPYHSNDLLEGAQWFGKANLPQPESVAIGPDGYWYTGINTGEIIRLNPNKLALEGQPDTAPFELVVNTGGRPLGMIFHPDGSLIVADAIKGLIQVSWSLQDDKPVAPVVKVLSTEADGQKFAFVDDVAVSSDGAFAWFSDASSKFPYPQFAQDILEHGGHGRLIEYEFATGQSRTLLKDLQFANGVAAAKDDAFILINETGAYRITRYWRTGPKAGLAEPFVENLPGFPDNIRADDKGNFWVAMPAARDGLIDGFADKPGIRKFLGKMLNHVHFPVTPNAMVLGFDGEGKLIANLQDIDPKGYYYITQATPVGNELVLGSVQAQGIARVQVP